MSRRTVPDDRLAKWEALHAKGWSPGRIHRMHGRGFSLGTVEYRLRSAELYRLREVIELYRDAAQVDATMEGPRFKGVNLSSFHRAWTTDLATQRNPKP